MQPGFTNPSRTVAYDQLKKNTTGGGGADPTRIDPSDDRAYFANSVNRSARAYHEPFEEEQKGNGPRDWWKRPPVRGFNAVPDKGLKYVNVHEWAEKVGGILPKDLEESGKPSYLYEFTCSSTDAFLYSFCWRPDNTCPCEFVQSLLCCPFITLGYLSNTCCVLDDNWLKSDDGRGAEMWRDFYYSKTGKPPPTKRQPTKVNAGTLLYYWFMTKAHRFHYVSPEYGLKDKDKTLTPAEQQKVSEKLAQYAPIMEKESVASVGALVPPMLMARE